MSLNVASYIHSAKADVVSVRLPDESDASRATVVAAQAISLQQEVARHLFGSEFGGSLEQPDLRRMSRTMFTRLIATLDWKPAAGNDFHHSSSMIAASEHHSFVGRVVEIDQLMGHVDALFTRRNGDSLIGEEMPVQIPLVRIPVQVRRRLRPGMRLDWEIDEWPMGDGEFLTKNRFKLPPERDFTPEEREHIDHRTKQLLARFAVDDGSDDI